MSRVLVIADTHEPFCHEHYMQFCVDVWNAWNCDSAVHIGDVTDNHMCSRHDKDPRAMGGQQEADKAYDNIQDWHATFPEMKVCIGNHDERPMRFAASIFFPERFVRKYSDAWETPGWDWKDAHEVDGVQYVHGINSTGKNAALNLAIASMQSTVQGHTHTFPGVSWNASSREAIFGLNVGCGMDVNSYAAAYGKHFKHKPVLGCGVVIDGMDAHFVKMDLGSKYRQRRKGRY